MSVQRGLLPGPLPEWAVGEGMGNSDGLKILLLKPTLFLSLSSLH
jgi:hypothetical protein